MRLLDDYCGPEIDALCDQFESSLELGNNPRIEELLDRNVDVPASTLLAELIKSELGWLIRAGRRPNLSDYTIRFPKNVDVVQRAFCDVTSMFDESSIEEETRDPNVDGPLSSALTGRTPYQQQGRISHYKLTREIARGGMGIVYVAEDIRLNRTVAIKKLLPQYAATKEAVKRIRAEAEAVAKLNHPNIVTVYELGEEGGEMFLVMPYIAGKTLFELQHASRQSMRDIAQILVSCADAVDHAHTNGVIHRDLQPSNVILDKSNVPWITDFGLAKIIDTPIAVTKSNQMLGTPGFTPPEQVSGQRDLIGPRSDVYGLGAILFFMLTDRPPFEATSPADALSQLLRDEPISPRHLNPSIDRDLETICIKCLQKRPDQRYASAGELRDDLRRWLSGHAITARPIGSMRRTFRLIRRKPAHAAVATLLITLLVAALLLARANYKTRLAEKTKQVETERRISSETLNKTSRYFNLLGQAKLELQSKQFGWKARSLGMISEAAELRASRADLLDIRSLLVATLDGVDVIESKQVATGTDTFCVDFSPDGNRLAIGKNRAADIGLVRIYDVGSGNLLREYFPRATSSKSHNAGVKAIRYSPNGQLLVAGMREGSLHSWSMPDGKYVQAQGHEHNVRQISFNANGTRFATCSDSRELIVWESSSLRQLGKASLGGPATSVSFRPGSDDALSYFAQDGWRNVDIVDEPEFALVSTEFLPIFQSSFQFSSNGSFFVASHDDTLFCRTADTAFRGKGGVFLDPQLVYKTHDEQMSSVSLSRDNAILASGSLNQDVKVWDVVSRKMVLRKNILSTSNVFVQFSPTEDRCAIASGTGVSLCKVSGSTVCHTAAMVGRVVLATDFFEDGRIACLMSANYERVESPRLLIWDKYGDLIQDVKLPSVGGTFRQGAFDVDFSSDGKMIAVFCRGHIFIVKREKVVTVPARVTDERGALRFALDSNRLFTIVYDELHEYDDNGEERNSWKNMAGRAKTGRGGLDCLEIADKYIVVGGNDNSLKFFNLNPRVTCIKEIQTESPVLTVAVWKTTAIALCGLLNGWLQAYSIPDGQLEWTKRAHRDRITSMVIVDNHLITGCDDGTISFWHLSTDGVNLRFSIEGNNTPVNALHLTPDGEGLAVVRRATAAVRIWGLSKIESSFAELAIQ